MSTQAIINKLDMFSGTEIFSTLFTQFAKSHAIPEHLPLLTDLGVKLENGQVILTDNAPLSVHRQGMYTGRVKKVAITSSK